MAGQFLVRRDVGSELSIEFSETSQPSSAEVESIILDVESEIKGCVNVARLAVPTKTGQPISYSILHNIVLNGVCARTQAAFGGNVLNLSPREELYYARYKEGMDRIENSPRFLVDAIDLTSEADTDIRSAFLEDSGISHPVKHTMIDVY